MDTVEAERPGLDMAPGASYIGIETVAVGYAKHILTVASTTTK